MVTLAIQRGIIVTIDSLLRKEDLDLINQLVNSRKGILMYLHDWESLKEEDIYLYKITNCDKEIMSKINYLLIKDKPVLLFNDNKLISLFFEKEI